MTLNNELKNKLKEIMTRHIDVTQSVKVITLAAGKHLSCLDRLVTDDIFLQEIVDTVADTVIKDVYSSIIKANAISQTAVALELEQLCAKYKKM